MTKTLLLILTWALSRGVAQETGQYIGREACATCHEEIAEQHALSPHYRTWRPVSELDNMSGLPQSLSEGEHVYRVHKVDSRWHYSVERPGHAAEAFPIHSIVGGERFGLSFLFLMDRVGNGNLSRPTLVEARYMLDWKTQKFRRSPGFPEELSPDDIEITYGRVLSPPFADKCLGCHPGPVENERAFSSLPGLPFEENGVTCERCHGPGSDHVEAVSNDASDLRIRNPTNHSRQESLKICSECHSGFFSLVQPRPGDALIASQASALIRSECYIQSGGDLACVDCHDPHNNGRHELARSVATCRRCHGDSGSPTCPVNPKDGCVTCHMPLDVQPGAFELIDHWIRVRR